MYRFEKWFGPVEIEIVRKEARNASRPLEIGRSQINFDLVRSGSDIKMMIKASPNAMFSSSESKMSLGGGSKSHVTLWLTVGLLCCGPLMKHQGDGQRRRRRSRGREHFPPSSPSKMAPKLSRIERKELENTIISKYKGDIKMKDDEIAKIFPQCTTRTVRRARSNILRYGTIDRPSKPLGPPAKVTENMWMAIWYELRRRPSLSQRAQANLLYKLYGIRVSRSTISRGVQWTKKTMITIAKERNRDLRDDFIYRRSLFELDQIICVDESGDDREIAIPKKGYAPRGVTPRQTRPFHGGTRVSFLPAYTIDGVIYSEVYEGTTNLEVFESFLENLLPHCGEYPKPRSVVIMDNATFHNISIRIKDLYSKAGVLLIKQSPYSPDLNAIEYFFGSFKNHIESRAIEDEDHIRGDLKNYIRMMINTLGRGENGKKWARGHFRMAQYYIED